MNFKIIADILLGLTMILNSLKQTGFKELSKV